MSLHAQNLESVPKSVVEAEAAAEEAGLRYVSDRIPGFTRKTLKSGAQYFDAKGKRIDDPKHLNRIKLLRIPPAWTNVWICAQANGHLQVTGRDQRGRKQYLYHEDWRKIRDIGKFEKMIEFGTKLPLIRRRVKADLKKHGMPRDKVLAAILSVMDQTLIRVGNEEYAKTNKSFGLTTIRNRHVKVKGDTVKFHFTGKSGKVHDIELSDPRVAKVIRRCQELPGQELFTYIGDDAKPATISSNDVNSYLKEIAGEELTAKDFRTWGGSVRAIRCFLGLGPCEEKKCTKVEINDAYKQIAAFLGNTVAVCKKYYIHPAVFDGYESGSLFRIRAGARTRGGLRPDEQLFLKLLKRSKLH